ncbi:hypothetical protein BT96DRAFT_1023687 [Gymnopus androsaceus JB14]|uniref:Uncharacterized protein n=1 Tax=Gymnopus androsaceus JB14 TaxID=1447944 RepID=A0A6A4H2C9_9AGAR|nr:hypothetical protein BT96DRAFT_1023687 [Gymnopus androsaceus JB14]
MTYHPVCNPVPPPSYPRRSSSSGSLTGAVSTIAPSRSSSVQSREAGERSPLLSKQLPESSRSSNRWVLKDSNLLVFAVPVLFVFAVLLFITSFQSPPIMKSKLTSFWVDITPDPMCSTIGARQYTATLSNVPEDWDNVEACMKTSFYVHGKVVSTSPICTVASALNSTTIVQGRWTIDFDQSDCVPVWSAISSNCSSYGVRTYQADLHVPPGLDTSSSCKATPAIIQERKLYPECELARQDDGSFVAKGHWNFFDQSECVPVWSAISSHCSSYGVRTYQADLHVPPGLDALSSCKATPAIIQEKKLYPECELARQDDGTFIAKGHWNISDQSECVPVWSAISSHCSSYGVRTYQADLHVPPGLDTLSSCKATPAIIQGKSLHPKCELAQQDDGTLVAKGHWNISDTSCAPQWVRVTPHSCYTYDQKRYTAVLNKIPHEMDPLKTCFEAPLQFFMDTSPLSRVYRAFSINTFHKPNSCGWDRDSMIGTWYLEHSDCRPTLISMQRYGCVGSGLQRFESEVADFGPHEDWYHLCTAIPYQWQGKTYLPLKCESRESWGKTRRYVLYNIPTDQCA